jgi:hypothetical protein
LSKAAPRDQSQIPFEGTSRRLSNEGDRKGLRLTGKATNGVRFREARPYNYRDAPSPGGMVMRRILGSLASGHGTLALIVLLGLGWLAGFLWF